MSDSTIWGGEELNPTQHLDIQTRADRFVAVTQLTDRILNPKVKGVRLVDAGQWAPPAWTDGRTIWLNKDVLPSLNRRMDRQTLVAWMGANYHELGHTLYSPRESSPLMKKVEHGMALDDDYAGLARVLNLIEDQRQERLMILRYRYIKPYLMRTTFDIVLRGMHEADTKADEEAGDYVPLNHESPSEGHKAKDIGRSWPWIAGRTWLPEGLRKASLAGYPGNGKLLAELIGQYQQIVDPANRDMPEAWDVLIKTHDLLVSEGFSPQQMPLGCGGKDGTAEAMKQGGQPAPAPHAKRDSKEAPAAGTADDTADGEPGDADGEGKGKGDQGSDQPEDGTPVPSEGENEGDDNQEKGGMGTGAGNGNETMADFEREINEAIEDAMKHDEAFKEHVDRTRESIDFDKSGDQSGLKQKGITKMGKVPSTVSAAAYRLGYVFRKFIDQAQPHWERETSHGRLNVQRFLTQEVFDYETLFDRFEQGMIDEVSLDVTILVDVSSSMGGWGTGETKAPVDLASEACWVIRRAVEKAEGKSTVLAYNSNSFLVNQTGSKPNPDQVEYMEATGSTDPTKAVEDTYQRLKGVDAAHKIVIALTDGDWYYGGDIMRKITNQGITTVGVLIKHRYYGEGDDSINAAYYQERMGVKHFKQIGDPMDMVALFEQVVTDRLTEVTGMMV